MNDLNVFLTYPTRNIFLGNCLSDKGHKDKIKIKLCVYVDKFLVRFSGLKLVEKQIVSTELTAAVDPCKKPILGSDLERKIQNAQNWTEPDNTATVLQLLLTCLFGEPRNEFRVTVIFTNCWKNNRRKYLNVGSLSSFNKPIQLQSSNYTVIILGKGDSDKQFLRVINHEMQLYQTTRY